MNQIKKNLSNFVSVLEVSVRASNEGVGFLEKYQSLGRLNGEPESPIEETFFNYMKNVVKKGHKIESIQPDFVCKDVAIEIDGKNYHSTNPQIENDSQRDKIYFRNGYKVVRVSGSAVYRHMETVKPLLEEIFRNDLARIGKTISIEAWNVTDPNFKRELYFARYPDMFYD